MSGWAGRRLYSREFHGNRVRCIRRSGGRCELVENGQRCEQAGHAVDHILNQARGGGDSLTNLQHLCEDHHRIKTLAEAQAGQAIRRNAHKRPVPKHPGLRRDPP